jgi:hypothetical protein
MFMSSMKIIAFLPTGGPKYPLRRLSIFDITSVCRNVHENNKIRLRVLPIDSYDGHEVTYTMSPVMCRMNRTPNAEVEADRFKGVATQQ